MQTKTWVKGYENHYKVDTNGNVYSYKQSKRGKKLKVFINCGRYSAVNIHFQGKQKLCSVHRLIALTFIPNPENKPYVNHKDGNKNNNKVSNLEWCTHQENVDHAVKTGLYINAKRGSDNYFAKIGEKEVLGIRAMKEEGYSNSAVAKAFGISAPHVSEIKNRKVWKHV